MEILTLRTYFPQVIRIRTHNPRLLRLRLRKKRKKGERENENANAETPAANVVSHKKESEDHHDVRKSTRLGPPDAAPNTASEQGRTTKGCGHICSGWNRHCRTHRSKSAHLRRRCRPTALDQAGILGPLEKAIYGSM